VGGLDPADAGWVIDASDCVVAPGFVDLHTHYDARVFWDPYCTLSGWQGLTSVVVDNCGFLFAPPRKLGDPALREGGKSVESGAVSQSFASIALVETGVPELKKYDGTTVGRPRRRRGHHPLRVAAGKLNNLAMKSAITQRQASG
jgi:hypothetical protein